MVLALTMEVGIKDNMTSSYDFFPSVPPLNWGTCLLSIILVFPLQGPHPFWATIFALVLCMESLVALPLYIGGAALPSISSPPTVSRG